MLRSSICYDSLDSIEIGLLVDIKLDQLAAILLARGKLDQVRAHLFIWLNGDHFREMLKVGEDLVLELVVRVDAVLTLMTVGKMADPLHEVYLLAGLLIPLLIDN